MITASPTAPDGCVAHLPFYTCEQFGVLDCAILCRNTAPLVSFAFSLIKRSIGCRILGREIGDGLITLLRKHSGTEGDAAQIDTCLTSLTLWFNLERAKLEAKEWWNSLNALQEKFDCIETIAQNVGLGQMVSKMVEEIQKLFTATPTKGLITLCTIHKSKGLEWHTVFVLDAPKLMPSKYAKQPWQQKQERNLHYVAITRAKMELYYINTGEWR